MEAARQCLIPRTTRRLTRTERADLIEDGAVSPFLLGSARDERAHPSSAHRGLIDVCSPHLAARLERRFASATWLKQSFERAQLTSSCIPGRQVFIFEERAYCRNGLALLPPLCG